MDTIVHSLYFRLLKKNLHIKRMNKYWNWSHSDGCIFSISPNDSLRGKFLNRYYIGES